MDDDHGSGALEGRATANSNRPTTVVASINAYEDLDPEHLSERRS